jgi:hypothetical protein
MTDETIKELHIATSKSLIVYWEGQLEMARRIMAYAIVSVDETKARLDEERQNLLTLLDKNEHI